MTKDLFFAIIKSELCISNINFVITPICLMRSFLRMEIPTSF